MSRGMPQIPSGGGCSTAPTSYCPSPRISMKDLRSKLSCIARRSAGLSKGWRRVDEEIGPAVHRLHFTDRLRCLALYLLHQRDRHLVRKRHVELAGDEGEDRGRAVRDYRVFDTVQIRSPRLPVSRVALHLDRLVGLVFDKFEGTRANWVAAHVSCRDMARIDRRIPGGEQGEEGRLRPFQVEGDFVVAVRGYFVEIEEPGFAVVEAQLFLGFSGQQIVSAFDVGSGERLAVMPFAALAQTQV